ncbi:MAG: 1-deoxy-D-xylulose-5-phosphate reductoisomerase [Gammaproteobacteria bacterium RIFCSPHIGHO2_12_FULL_42_13]|nr:MAG: 1-deoxy-D-xylulose-5-phosphate reductoisomerase [Gammaproteobacteria bacterium RIFCSPHIGHO2_12_FULL_42_13]
MRSVTVLGATGSIGQSTLDIVARHPDRFRVEALTAHTNIALLFRQCLQHRPRYAAVSTEALAKELQAKLHEENSATEVVFGEKAISELAFDAQSDTVMAGIVGAAGLLPTLQAVKAGKRVLLANKESLVMAADIFMQAVREHQAILLPVDSEHNAIFQCLPKDFLPGKTLSGVQAIILTASGGPFREMPMEQLATVTPAQAIAHPNWVMGPKVSIDSATMMNKGLEVIEAHGLFGLPIEKIQVAIHPQSIVHSLVQFEDASFLTQLGCPDMRIPISYTLDWPNRIVSGAKSLDIVSIARLDFQAVSLKRFPCLRLAYQALKWGGTATTVLNAANEVAVEAFCHGQIRFDQIGEMVDHVLQQSSIIPASSLPVVLEADRAARACAQAFMHAQIV